MTVNKNYTCFRKNQWYFENPDVPFDISEIMIGIKIKKKLYSGRSPFQRIEFFDVYYYGKILALNGIVQTSEKDEFIYHEMICHPPMLLHKNPKKVLIVGGGDGGSLEEILKHKIEKVWMVEIDKKVVELCQKYLPSISKGAFKNKKTELIIGNGKEFIKKYKNFFDVIILDLSDPGGPAKELISSNFYKDVKNALANEGIVSIQSGSFSYQPKPLREIFKRIQKIFPSAEIRKLVVPVYQAGEFSFIIGAKSNIGKLTFKDIERRFKKVKIDLNYYTPEIHFASKILPPYLKKIIA
ncbi:MAG: polyamine aminopropyltransferase [Patescibacteria group bacterium]